MLPLEVHSGEAPLPESFDRMGRQGGAGVPHFM